MNMVLILGAIVLSLTKDVSRDIALLVFPLLLGIAGVYNLNNAAEVAALAEQRDRLSSIVNSTLPKSVFLHRIVADRQRGSAGTMAVYVMAGMVVVGAVVVGLINATSIGGWLLVLQVGVSFVVCGAFVIGVVEISRVRLYVNNKLDTALGSDSRPPTAPMSEDPWWKKFRDGLFGRDQRSVYPSTADPLPDVAKVR